MLETKTAAFTFVKQGIFYFSRRVPSDLSHHYDTDRISYSLRTRSAIVANSRATRAAQQLDEHWYHLRLKDVDLPGKHRLRSQSLLPAGLSGPQSSVSQATVKLSETVGIYLRLKGQGRPVTFHRAAERSCGYVIDVCGDKDITAYTKADANAFRDDLLKRKLAGSSITRIFGTVRSIINFAASEVGIDITNPFGRVYFDRKAGVEERAPLPVETIRALQTECRDIDDDLRCLVALISDTGMRLAEAAGLLREDLKLDDPVPHVVIREHPWRRLKTSSSSRKVPLVGAAQWAAKREKAGGMRFFRRWPKDVLGKLPGDGMKVTMKAREGAALVTEQAKLVREFDNQVALARRELTPAPREQWRMDKAEADQMLAEVVGLQEDEDAQRGVLAESLIRVDYRPDVVLSDVSARRRDLGV